VLIVDDVPDNLAVLHDALDEAGYTVLVATEGHSALQRAAQADPDIVLLDAVMPGIDGFEVARRLKAGPETAHIPIIFMTGLTDTEHVLAAFDAGGVDYVTKPIRAPEVLARMAAHMQAARQARQARNALDAYGHATLAVRLDARGARLIWQTPLARQWLPRYFGSPPEVMPPELHTWLQAAAAGRDVRPLSTQRLDAGINSQLVATLQGRTVDDDWLVVLREVSDAATVQATMQAFRPDAARKRSAVLGGQGQDQPRHRRHPGQQPGHREEAPGTRLRKAGCGDTHRGGQHGAAAGARAGADLS
jgi:CheY-like chemotaxis protein